MQTDVHTLVKLLQDLDQELQTCLKSRQISGAADPILLGDFIVDAYNRYLSAARAACDDAAIGTLPEVEKLGGADHATERRSRVGDNPRLHKMHEVAFSVRQLLTLLERAAETERARSEGEISGVIALLDNLGNQVRNLSRERSMKQIGRREHAVAEFDAFVRPLQEEYNRYLAIVIETTDDPVVAKLFRPLNTEEGDVTPFEYRLSELRLAQSGLLSYLRKGGRQSGGKTGRLADFKAAMEREMLRSMQGEAEGDWNLFPST